MDQNFNYDALNRLTTAAGDGYGYDAAGNLLQITGATAPIIAVEQPAGTGLTDGASSISFGSVSLGSSSSAFIFTIRNTGTADLTGLSVTKDGTHSGDFGLSTTGMLTTLIPGNSTTFTVVFSPSASGARTAALHITSNDTPRSPFDIALTGTGATTLFTISTSSNPVAGGTTSGGGSLASGSQANLTATANAGYAFVNWTEGGTPVSGLASYAFDVTAARSLVANFTPVLSTVSALDAAAQTFGSAGTTAWYGQGAVTHDGVDAARSGMIGDSEASSLTTTITGPANVSFYWKVSSETSWDFLRVYVDDVDQGGGISGEVGWAQQTLSIPAGAHTLRWTYSKDGSVSAGSDAGFVDELVVQSTAVGGYAYLRYSGSAPWEWWAVPGEAGSNEAAMNTAFGAGNWADLRFETASVGGLFSSAYRVIYLDGSDTGATELEAFIQTNMTVIQQWVSDGGRLFVNSAPNEDNGMSFGFGVTLTYSNPSSVAGNVIAAVPGHAIFTTPASASGPFSGNSFSHGTVSGAGLTTLISGTGSDAGKVALAEMAYGSGKVLFGGMTPSYFHSPQPGGNNLRANILSYLNQMSSSNTALETWRQTHFGTTANTGNAADTNDPDKDGIPNLAEFAFDLNPNQNSAGLLPQPQLAGGNLSVTFTKPSNVSGIGYEAETSTTLLSGSWMPATNTGLFPNFQFSVPVGSAPRMFMRLKVTALLPPPAP